jgi:hypothetical protein
MINSYNLLTGRNKLEEILNSGIGVFCHSPEEKDALNSIKFMISYFENLEMYNKCLELKKYIEETFDDNGKYKGKVCECIHPDIETYTPTVKCSICSLTIKR